jgi:hypothetical protein
MAFFNKRMILLFTNLFLLAGIGTTIANYSTSVIQGEANVTGLTTITFNIPTTTSTSYNADGTHPTIGRSSLLQEFVGNGTTTFVTSIASLSTTYPGNGSGGPGSVLNAIKLGSSSANGTFTLNTRYTVTQVVIDWVGWHVTNTSRISVAGVNGSPVAKLTFSEETFTMVGGGTKSITISTIDSGTGKDRRAIIKTIKLYHVCSEF